MTLPEGSAPEEIIGMFREHGWELALHSDSPPRGEASDVPRALRALPRFTHWAALVSIETGSVVSRWYGGGMDEADAVRSSLRRWRAEQGESAPRPSSGSQP